MICRLFVSLCYLFRARFLCFHQLAASFCKIPGGVGYLSGTSAPSASLHPACPELRGEPRRARYPLSLLLLPRGTTPGGERADPFSRRSRCALSTFRINTCKSVSKQTTLTPFRINTGSVDIPGTVLISRVDKKRLTVFSDGAGGTMAEVGLLPFARVALEVATQVLPSYRTRFSKHQFTQPQLLAGLCLFGSASSGVCDV